MGASNLQGQEIAGVSAEVHRLVARYPETSHAAWIALLVLNFLMVIPVVFGAIYVCVLLKVNGTLGFIFGLAAWLGLFMFWRQCMFWQRQSKVSALIQDFETSFPGATTRPAAENCLRAIKDEDNEVLVLAKERLCGAGSSKPAVLSLAASLNAGVGLPGGTDPRIDAQVGQLLSALQTKLMLLNWIHWIGGLGLPLTFFVMAGINEPSMSGGELLWGTFIILIISNIVLSLVLGFVETPALRNATKRFLDLFPRGRHEHAIALAALTRVAGCAKAKARLRSELRTDEDEDEDEDKDTSTHADSAKNDSQAAKARALTQDSAPLEVAAVRPAQGSPAPAQALGSGIELEPFAPATQIAAPKTASAQAPLPVLLETAATQTAQAKSSAAPASAAPPQKRFCTQCGTPLTPNLRFCTHCGAKLG